MGLRLCLPFPPPEAESPVAFPMPEAHPEAFIRELLQTWRSPREEIQKLWPEQCNTRTLHMTSTYVVEQFIHVFTTLKLQLSKVIPLHHWFVHSSGKWIFNTNRDVIMRPSYNRKKVHKQKYCKNEKTIGLQKRRKLIRARGNQKGIVEKDFSNRILKDK